MLHVLGPFRREGGIERDFLAAHAATGARFIGVHGGVPPLVDEADEGRRRHRPGEQETLHRVATRLPQPRKAVGWALLQIVGGDKLIRHCCKVSDEAAFCLIQRPYISKTLLTRRISPRGSP